MSDALKQLKDVITIMLDDCDPFTYPHVCNMAGNQETRPELEEMIINMAKKTGDSVGAIIHQIERAYNPNMMED